MGMSTRSSISKCFCLNRKCFPCASSLCAPWALLYLHYIYNFILFIVIIILILQLLFLFVLLLLYLCIAVLEGLASQQQHRDALGSQTQLWSQPCVTLVYFSNRTSVWACWALGKLADQSTACHSVCRYCIHLLSLSCASPRPGVMVCLYCCSCCPSSLLRAFTWQTWFLHRAAMGAGLGLQILLKDVNSLALIPHGLAAVSRAAWKPSMGQPPGASAWPWYIQALRGQTASDPPSQISFFPFGIISWLWILPAWRESHILFYSFSKGRRQNGVFMQADRSVKIIWFSSHMQKNESLCISLLRRIWLISVCAQRWMPMDTLL